MEALWVDKYRPKILSKLSFHNEINEVLEQMASTSDFPHILFYGPEGAGKKTRAYAFLERVFGAQIYKLRSEDRVLKPEGTSVTIDHIELTPSDNEHHDRHIVQHVVKDIAEMKEMDRGFKVLLINEADRLSKEAQGGLRRTMEKYMKNCRMILLCTHVHKLIAPIRSRCLNIRVPAPDNSAIVKVFEEIAEKEFKGYVNLPAENINEILSLSKGNLRAAIIHLQLYKHCKAINTAPYLKETAEIAQLIIKEQSAPQLRKIRDKFYDLLVNCIEGEIILKEVLSNLIHHKNLSEKSIKEMIHYAAEYEKTLMSGSKAVYHLEAFAAHAMEIIFENK